MTFLEKKNVFFVINGSKYIIYVKIARGDRIPLKCGRPPYVGGPRPGPTGSMP